MEMILNVMDSWQVPLLVHQLHQWHTTSWLDGWLHYQPSLFDCVTVGQQLRVSFGTILPIFIEIGSYLADKEQKISWHSFFETRCILALTPTINPKLPTTPNFTTTKYN